MKMKEEERMSMEMALKTEIFIWDLNQLKGPTWARCLFWGWVFLSQSWCFSSHFSSSSFCIYSVWLYLSALHCCSLLTNMQTAKHTHHVLCVLGRERARKTERGNVSGDWNKSGMCHRYLDPRASTSGVCFSMCVCYFLIPCCYFL